jgi:hypothetical protein
MAAGMRRASAIVKCPVSVVQPESDGLSRERGVRDEIEIVVAVDIRHADGDGIASRFEGDIRGRLSGDRELDAITVTARAREEAIGGDDIGPAIGIEVADRRRPAEAARRVAQRERRAIERTEAIEIIETRFAARVHGRRGVDRARCDQPQRHKRGDRRPDKGPHEARSYWTPNGRAINRA